MDGIDKHDADALREAVASEDCEAGAHNILFPLMDVGTRPRPFPVTRAAWAPSVERESWHGVDERWTMGTSSRLNRHGRFESVIGHNYGHSERSRRHRRRDPLTLRLGERCRVDGSRVLIEGCRRCWLSLLSAAEHATS
jgi:hypothetical protein